MKEFNNILEVLFNKGEEFKKELQHDLEGFEVELEKNLGLENPNLILTVYDQDSPLIEIEINLVFENGYKLETFMASGFEENNSFEISKVFEISNINNTWEELTNWIYENIEESED